MNKSTGLAAFFATILISCPGNLFAENDSSSSAEHKYNFNPEWKLFVGESPDASKPAFDDSKWKPITLPHAWNEDEAYVKDIHQLSESTSWYRKHFVLPKDSQDKKVFLEFEGIRQAGEVFVNGTAGGNFRKRCDGIWNGYHTLPQAGG